MASVPYSFECDKSSGFMMDPNEHKSVGYIIDLHGFGLGGAPQVRDLTVSLPFKNPAPAYKPLVSDTSFDSAHNTVKVVGVIEQFKWDDSTHHIQIDFYVSQANVSQIKALQQSPQKSSEFSGLEFWIANYDQETKQWYEQLYPSSGPLRGIMKNLNVDPTPQPVKDGMGINVNVHRVSIEITPQANQTTHFSLATSSRAPVVKPWGLVVGSLSAKTYEGSV